MSLFPANLNRPLLAERFYAISFFSLATLWASFAFSPALVEITSIAALVGWLGWKKFSEEPCRPFPRALLIPLGLYLAFTLISVVFSEYPSKSFRGVFKVLQQLMIFFLSAEVFARENKKRFFEKALVLIALVVMADGFFQYFAGFDFLRFRAPEASGAGVRLSAGFGTYGKFAAYLICVIPVLAVLGFFYVRQNRLFAALSFVTTLGFLGLLFFTRSRGAFVGFFAGIFLTFLFARKFRLLFFLIIAAGAVIVMLPHNMVIHLDAERKEQSIVERYYLWDRAWHVIKAKPLTGTGINTYAAAHQKYDVTNNWRVRDYYAHNGYLQMAAEIGVPGVLSFLAFLVILLAGGFRAWRRFAQQGVLVLGLLASVLSFMVFAGVDTLLHSSQPVIMFWFLCGLLASYTASGKNKLDEA